MKKNITLIVFQINKAVAFEWIIDNIDNSKFNLSFISIGADENSDFELFCGEKDIEFYLIKYESKKEIFSTLFKTYKILKKLKPDVVHCHIFEGGLIGLTAAKLAGIKERIYTRHYSTYHHTYAPGGLKYDKLIHLLSTKIVAISENVMNILIEKENVDPEKVILIHHGFDLNLLYNVTNKRIEIVKQKYNPENKYPVIGVVSRFTHWKGVQYIIPAYKQLIKKYPNALLMLCNAKGDYKKEIHNLLKEIPENSYKEIVFESDNAALFNLFDVFVHVPIDKEIEAFGQIYVEALAVGIPSVFTLSGIGNEFIVDKENALTVDFNNSEQIYIAICELLKNKDLREKISQNGKRDIEQLFSLSLMIQKLEELYGN